MAVRTAVGAARVRLIRQLLTETLLLFAVGGVAGLVLAQGMLKLLVGLLPAFSVPVNLSMPLDGRVVAFALGLSFVSAVLSGVAPALHASRADVISALKDQAQGPTDRLRLRHAFVVAQIAFSILLVVVAALLVRAFDHEASVAHGFDPQDVDIAVVDLSQAGYTSATGPAFAQRLLESVRALPGVEAASLADHPPEPGGRTFGSVQVPGGPPLEGRAFFNWTLVTPHYFRTVRIPLLKGRDFTDADRASNEAVMILGETAAKRLFGPDGDAIGRYVTVQSTLIARDGARPSPTQVQVVGVVGDVQFGGTPPLQVYGPLAQRYVAGLTILARPRNSDANLVRNLRQVITAMDPNLPVLSIGSLAARGSGPVETQLRIGATVAASVALIGLWLAGIGVYGVTAYSVAQRTREIGIRLSLGATAREVVWLVLGRGVRVTALGSGIGLLLAVAAGRLLAQSRFGVPAFDPVALGTATFLLAVVCLVACSVPLRRATRINAMEALRYE
jgi:putative ABC transport system permease protein